MNLKTIGIVLAVIAVGLIGYWAISGAEIYTLQQIQVTEVDPLFGSETKVWKDSYRPGLLDLIGPIAGGLIVIAGLVYWLGSRRKATPP